MSISVGLGPSTFGRKMENALPMKEEMAGKSCLFPARVGIFDFDVITYKVLFPILYLDLACKQLCYPPGKGIYRRNESTKTQELLLFPSCDDNTQYC